MSSALRIVFMGTPDFAVASLKKLLASKHEIVGVITAPDKPAGRGKKLSPPPIKTFALEAGIKTILQPASLKNPEFLSQLQALKADLQIVVAFRMLPQVVWAMPPKGTVNLHASLLPDYRGAAPINWCLINGERVTGVTTFFIEKNIDTGKIIFREKVTIDPYMNAGELHDKLMLTGADLLVKTANAIAENNYKAIPQNELMNEDDEGIIHDAPKIFKEDCQINWEDEAHDIFNFIRGLSPYPAAWTELSNDKETLNLKIYDTRIEPTEECYPNGHILTNGKSYLKVATLDGLIDIRELQLAGKKRMKITEFLRGFQQIEKYHFL